MATNSGPCRFLLLPSLAVLLVHMLPALSQTSSQGTDQLAEIANNLANPVADLVSVPFQNNWDYNVGPDKQTLYTLNVQPVIPINLDDRFMLITRTIVPYVSYHALAPMTSGAGGLSDTQLSVFLSTRKTLNGWILGAGPVLVVPTATSRATGSGKWSAGPTIVVGRQGSGWTYGLLANQLWSFAGPDSRKELNTLFLEPWLMYTTKTYTTFGVFTESTYDWLGKDWTVPIDAIVSQVLMAGNLPFSVTLGGRYWAKTPEWGPNWGFRFNITLIFQENKAKPKS